MYLTEALVLQSLSFARAASVMRACAFKIQPGTDPTTLHLPFVGRARAAQICDLATTGTTAELVEHRYNDLHCRCTACTALPLLQCTRCRQWMTVRYQASAV